MVKLDFRLGWLLLLSCGLLVQSAFAQNEWAVGTAMEANYKFDLPRAWRIVIGPGTEIRPYFKSTEADAVAPPTLRNLDFNAAVTRRWLERWRFGTAIRLRSRYPFSDEAAREVRTWWFAERISDAGYTRFIHRFRTEQRFVGDVGEPLQVGYRHRYRLGFERALAGQNVDFGEYFLTGSAEVMVSTAGFAARPKSIDLRPSLLVGRKDLSIGLEYRYEHRVGDAMKQIQQTLLLAVQYSL